MSDGARLIGKVHPSWCHLCKATPGPDCPDCGKSKRQVKRAERRQWMREVLDA